MWKKNKYYIPDGINQGFLLFFLGRAGAAAQATPARRDGVRPCNHARSQMPPPRRRAFRCNGCQASHFRCNPSRKLVECYTRFAASTAQPRLKGLPRRACPTHHSLPRVAALVPRSLTTGYQSLASNGAMSRKMATPPDTRT